MPLRNARTVKWAPVGLTDSLDGTAAFPGAMWSLANLIPAQNQAGAVVCRPALVQVASLPDWGGGPLTALFTVGNMAYGMYASATFAGKDRPFAYDMAASTFLTIAGITSANLPTTQPTTGDWTPPTMDAVGTRIVVTHPGFPDGPFIPSFYDSITANTYNGSATVDGYIPNYLNYEAGMMVSGAGIPSGATVLSTAAISAFTTATGTAGSSDITVASATGIVLGMHASGPGFDAFVTGISGTTLTLSVPLFSNLTDVPALFAGQKITLSANATADHNQETILITSDGTVAAKFGWLDISNTSVARTGHLTLNSSVIGIDDVTGIQNGMTVTGTGIPANTVIQDINNPTLLQVSGVTSTSGNNLGIVVPIVPGQAPPIPVTGQAVYGLGIQPNTVVASSPVINWIGASQIAYGVPLSLPPIPGVSGLYSFTGIFSLTLSNLATATVGSALTISGGTSSAPLWGAGDTSINQLAGKPVFVKQFAGRAYFGINTTNPPTAGVTASDSGLACQVTNANQVILFDDQVPVTAAWGLPLQTQLGGIVQALMVFQGDANIRQITGDFALGNWAQNSSQVATGTLSPNTISASPKGLLFAASDGIRRINFDGGITDPLGARGQGLTLPFSYALAPSRSAATFNENIYRITVTWQPPVWAQAVWGSSVRTDEFWLHNDTEKWSGPHASTMDMIEPWISEQSFLCAPSWGRGALYRGDVYPMVGTSYTENGTPLEWIWGTVLLPDTPGQFANAVVESTIFFNMPDNDQALVSAIDDNTEIMARSYVYTVPGPTGGNSVARQRPIYWNTQAIFRQMRVEITGAASGEVVLGELALRYQQLGYQLTEGMPWAPIWGTGDPWGRGAPLP